MVTPYHTADVPFTSMDIPIHIETSNYDETRGSVWRDLAQTWCTQFHSQCTLNGVSWRLSQTLIGFYGPYSPKTLNVSSSSCPCSSTQPWTRTGEWRRSSKQSQTGPVTKISGQLIHAPGLFTSRKSSLYTLDRRLGGAQRRYGGCGEERLLLPGTELRLLGRPAHNLVTLRIKLSRLGTNPYGGGMCEPNL